MKVWPSFRVVSAGTCAKGVSDDGDFFASLSEQPLRCSAEIVLRIGLSLHYRRTFSCYPTKHPKRNSFWPLLEWHPFAGICLDKKSLLFFSFSLFICNSQKNKYKKPQRSHCQKIELKNGLPIVGLLLVPLY